MKKVSWASACYVGSGRGCAVKSATAKTGQAVSCHDSTTQKHNVPPVEVATVVRELNVAPAPALCSSIVSPQYLEDSVCIDGTVSTCDSMKSPDYEYSNNGDSSMLTPLEGQANKNLCILEDRDDHGLFSAEILFVICA